MNAKNELTVVNPAEISTIESGADRAERLLQDHTSANSKRAYEAERPLFHSLDDSDGARRAADYRIADSGFHRPTY